MDTEMGLESLDRAVAARLPVSMLAVVDGGAIEVPGKFLNTQDDGDARGLWVQPIGTAHARTLDQLAKEKATVRATFCDAGTRLTFGSALQKRERAHWLNPTIAVEAVLLRWPEEVTSPEMRVARRFRISDKSGRVSGRLFFRDPTGTREVPSASLWDLSTGGISFVCPLAGHAQFLKRGDLFVAVVHYHGKQIMLPSRYTHAREFSSRAVRLGFRFDLANPMLEFAKADLARVCQELEAAESRNRSRRDTAAA